MKFDLNYSLDLFIHLVSDYLSVTLGLALLGFCFALILSILIATLRVLKLPIIHWFIDIYISFFRATPLLVQLFLIYYGLPQMFPYFAKFNAYEVTVLGLTIHFAAYMAEVIRGAILSIDINQHEAAMSIGMTQTQAMWRIILPQALKNAIPSLMNNFVDMIKSTSLGFTLGLAEIMGRAQAEAASSFKFFESFMVVAFIYWAVIVLFTRAQQLIVHYINLPKQAKRLF
jgi:putative amino-acid transport system permease protein